MPIFVPGLSRRTLLATVAGTVLCPAVARAIGVASTIRVHDHATHTRLVLELSENIEFSIFSLADPYRIVADLPELDWTVDGNALRNPVGVIKTVRYGLFQPGRARIVLDLEAPAGVKNAFVLPATGDTPHRFVMDLERTSREKFLSAAGPQHRIGRLAAISGKPVPEKAVTDAAPKDPNRKKLIVIDPGHGGVDPGTIGGSGVYEKTLTLAAAKQLKGRLEATGRYRVKLTRERDISLGLAERREIGRAAQADLFISLHADSIANRTIRGLSVYTLSEKASDREAEELAEQENSADSIIGVDLSHESQEVRHILVDLAQRESMNLATKLADRLIGELKREATLLRNGHRFARFAVLKSPDVPSVLIEMGYLSNREDEKALKSVAYRGKLMAAVVRGVDSHFGGVQSAKSG
ncbi:MAG: N-acetylmuramoyl-L-alanine amidase [Rhodospirillaceae bacterium]